MRGCYLASSRASSAAVTLPEAGTGDPVTNTVAQPKEARRVQPRETPDTTAAGSLMGRQVRARFVPLLEVGVITSAAAAASVALPEMASNPEVAPGLRQSVLHTEGAVCHRRDRQVTVAQAGVGRAAAMLVRLPLALVTLALLAMATAALVLSMLDLAVTLLARHRHRSTAEEEPCLELKPHLLEVCWASRPILRGSMSSHSRLHPQTLMLAAACMLDLLRSGRPQKPPRMARERFPALNAPAVISRRLTAAPRSNPTSPARV